MRTITFAYALTILIAPFSSNADSFNSLLACEYDNIAIPRSDLKLKTLNFKIDSLVKSKKFGSHELSTSDFLKDLNLESASLVDLQTMKVVPAKIEKVTFSYYKNAESKKDCDTYADQMIEVRVACPLQRSIVIPKDATLTAKPKDLPKELAVEEFKLADGITMKISGAYKLTVKTKSYFILDVSDAGPSFFVYDCASKKCKKVYETGSYPCGS
jgi:hypothetical protein